MTKRTTGGHSDLMGTRAEERFIVTKKSPEKNDECCFRFSIYYIARTIIEGECMYFKNVMSGTMKHVFVRKARGNSLVVYATDNDCTSSDQNCTYGGTFSIHCKEFSNSFSKLQY